LSCYPNARRHGFEQQDHELKIGILEWICGGGLQETDPTQIAESLLNEGRAMLSSVAQDFLNCGHEVITAIDEGLSDRLLQFGSDSRIQVNRDAGYTSGLPSSWWKIAHEADAIVVIAPEFSSILQSVVYKLRPACRLLVNCGDDFLKHTCDKWLTAQQLGEAQIHHPTTQLVTAVTNRWLEEHRCNSGQWIIKPRDGAGCDAIQLADDKTVQSVLTSMRSADLGSKMILQPLHQGAAFSRSAIIDATGDAHWLPLVTQEFTVGDSMTYCGGKVLDASDSPSLERLDKVLAATAGALGPGALGWVGVDLIYSNELDDWIVIEINPRLTTSFVGLSAAYGSGLMEQMLSAVRGLDVFVKPSWKSVSFDAAGNVHYE
jgi:tyramine---L-glutamate ligase